MNALRTVLLAVAIALPLSCVSTEKLEQDVATLRQHQEASDKLVTSILKRLAAALAQLEAAQKEIARALAVGGDN